ncbi:MAG TPA: tetratricopeptide repeat protein, partial [Thermoleophilaceae bacterium]|nr:tetratricopeptide repeat protein [Thermoleophilaceae bacterium]
PLAIPATLQDSLMARLDRLAPVKEVAQLAATLGRHFSHELLAAVSRLDASALTAALARLLDAELIYRRGVPPDAAYEFKHALVQDVAYGSMLRSKRAQLHREIADVLEERLPQVAGAKPELLAHHLREAGLPARAVPYAVRAGDAAARRYASVEARAHYQAALEMAESLPPSAAASRLQIRAVVRLATVALGREHFERDLANLERARGLAERAGSRLRLGQIHYWIGRTNYVLGRFDEAIDHAERALRIGEASGGRDEVTAPPVNLLARVHCLRGESRQASAYAARSAEQMRKLGNAIEEAAINGVLAFALGLHGRFAPAREAADRGIALARDLDHLPTLAAAFFFRGVVAGWYGRLEPAEADFEEALALCARAGDAFREYVARGWRGEAYLLAGRVDAAEEDLTRCLALGDRIGTTFHRGAYQAFLAEARLRHGDIEAALRLGEDALRVATATAQPWSRSIALRVTAETLLRTESPDLPRAENAVRTAIEIQNGRECLPDLARSHLVLGEVLAASGDRGGADAAFDVARRMLDDMGIVRSRDAAPVLT